MRDSGRSGFARVADPAYFGRMTTVAKPARLLKELAALPYEELDKLVPRILALRAQKHPAVLPHAEAALVKKISAGPPPKLVRDYERLMKKRKPQAPSAAERKQLDRLVAEFDAFHLRHLGWLTQLAAIRQSSVPAIVRAFGLKKPRHGAEQHGAAPGRRRPRHRTLRILPLPGELRGQFVLHRSHSSESRRGPHDTGESGVRVPGV